MERSADGETTGGVSTARLRRRSAHALLVAVGVLIGLAMVGVAGSSGLTDVESPAAVGSSQPFTAEQLSTLQAVAAGATVRVTGEGCGATAVGTGFAIDEVLVTNSHIVSGARSVTVDALSSDGASAVVEVVRKSSVVDLAELGVGSLPTWSQGVSLNRGVAVRGEPVLLAGFLGGRQLRFVEATVHLVVPGDAYGIEGEVVLIDGASGPGFSGGPVLNRGGEAVAVLKGIDETTGLTIAISTAMLDESSLFNDMNQDDRQCR